MLLVTGHRGFIGTRLCDELEARGIKYVGYDLVEGNDIRDAHQLDKFFEENQIDRVIHLAALAGVRRGEDYQADYIATNIVGTDNVLRISEKCNVSKVILFSSSSVYDEEGDFNPRSFYGITKYASEFLPNRYSLNSVVIVRPFTVYGENGRKDQVFYKWINQIKEGKILEFYGKGDSERSYTYVGDLVDGVIKILEKNFLAKREHFDLGGAESIRLKDVLKIYEEVVPHIEVSMVPQPKADANKNVADISKARNVLGYDPRPIFEERLRKILRHEFGKKT